LRIEWQLKRRVMSPQLATSRPPCTIITASVAMVAA